MQEVLEKQFNYVIGKMNNIIYSNFKNPLSPYCVCEVAIHDTNIDDIKERIRVILHSTPPEKNTHTYKFFGRIETSKKHGLSFHCETYIRDIPIDSTQVVEFLSSGLFHGIKRKRAERIVEMLGEDCLIQIVNSPEVLRQIKGIPEKTITSIQETIIENLGMQKIITKLHEWNISLNLAKKIYKLYGDASVQKIMENPYCLANTIGGVSFKKADEIANKVDIHGSDSRRVKGAIEYALHEIYEEDGSTFASKGYIMQRTANILYDQDGFYYPSEIIDENLNQLVSTNVEELEGFSTEIGQVRQIGQRIYLEKYYSYEQKVAEKLSLLHSKKELLDDKELSQLINYYLNIKRSLMFQLSIEQDMAIIESMRNNVLVITGGPGTGKSTIIKMILMLYQQFFEIDNFYQFLKKVILLAPTGRAAKRMSEITEIPAQTIHHFLVTQELDNQKEENRLFIIDEMSMMDLWTMDRFLERLNEGDRIIFVGDKEQLPPIKAGKVFQDIIDSGKFVTVELSTIFRQKQHSMINDLAASIRNGDISEKLFDNSGEVSWFPTDKDNIVEAIRSEVLSTIKKGIPFNDIQIIAPIHRGEQGITFINTYMQNLLITGEIPSATRFTPTRFKNGQYTFYVGDRVIQLKNNSEKMVLNGDLGEVVGVLQPAEKLIVNEETLVEEIVDEPERLIVRFDNIEVLYYPEEINELALAYCFSVHKAQGSEFPHVLLPISSGHKFIMNRNLLYTAITRAKKEITIIGELDVFLQGLQVKPRQRFTFLREMLLTNLKQLSS